MATETAVRGGSWLIDETPAGDLITRERLTEEQRLIGQTAEEFVDGETLPVLDRLEQKDWTLARTLVKRAGELGLLATDVPEEYGGIDVDKVSSVIVGEAVGRCASFATTFGAQTGLTLDQIDLVELNEAFAAQVLACLRELPIDPDRLNVNGGAIALGHPLGCTGAKLTATLVYEMRRRQARYGLVTMCVGGGMGAAGIFERP